MSAHTTFRIGGPAEIMAFPGSEAEILGLIREAGAADVPVFVMGNGSNLLVRDGGIVGLVIALEDRFAECEIRGECVRAQAGITLARLAGLCQRAGLAGLEFAHGIPGTLGGGAAMNAGAYGGQLSDALTSARVLLDGEVSELNVNELEMGYRASMPLRRGGLVLSADFSLKRDDPEAIRARMAELAARRREKQPLDKPSAGSVFKRPEGHFAGQLIQQAGLMGARVGGARVSEKHAGFIVNEGGATAGDVLQLIQRVREGVMRDSGVNLECEIRVVGRD